MTQPKMKSMNDIAILLTKLEGKKKQVNIAQIREILAQLSEIAVEQPEALAILIKNGVRRLK